MANTKVLVVDDSMTMRALISGALERIPGVEVVGLADGAAEAREMVESLRPHVMTLDIEMPGMSGIEYLAELMEKRPMPVIMFSTRTTAGAEDSVEALRLGAVDCFPKPKVAVPAELDVIIAKLGKRIKAAKGAELKGNKPIVRAASIDWNGRLLVVGADASSTKTMFTLFGTLPADCPPVVVVQHLGAGLTESMVHKLDSQVAPKVVIATDDMPIEPGTIYFAPQGDAHLVVSGWPNGRLKLLPRDPVAGERPSISLLFASAAKAAGAETVALLLMPDTEDGSTGLNTVFGVKGHGLSQAEGGGFSMSRGMATQPVATDALYTTLSKLLSK